MPTKRKEALAYVERANSLNDVSEATATLITVLASTDSSIERDKLQLSAYECASCSTLFSSKKECKPFCANCGSHDVSATADIPVSVSEVPANEMLSNVLCTSCGTHNIIPDAIHASLKGHMHCIECGTDIEFAGFPENVEPEEQLEQLEQMGDPADLLQDQGLDQEDSDTEGDDDLMDVTETEDLDDEVDGDESDIPADVQDQEMPVTQQSADEDSLTDDASEQDQPDLQQTGDQEVDPIQDTEQDVQISMLQYASKDSDVKFVQVEDKIYAFVDEVPVACLLEENAGKNKDAFYKKAFHATLAELAETKGVAAVCASFKFTPLVMSLPRSRIISEIAEKEMAAVNAKREEGIASLKKEFTSALSVVAQGLNKNLLQGKKHPLKAALFAELTSANVKAPAKLVDRVFSNYGDQFNEVLISTTLELLNRSPEARAEFAATIGDSVSYRLPEESSAEDDADLSGPTIVESSVDEIEETASDNVRSISRLTAKAGGSLFG